MGQDVSTESQPSNTQGQNTLLNLKKLSSSTPSLMGLRRSDSIKKSRQLDDSNQKLGLVGDTEEIPDEQTLTKHIEQVIKDLGLASDKADLIRTLPREKRWLLLKQHKSTIDILKTSTSSNQSINLQRSDTGAGLKNTEQYVEAIKMKQTPQQLSRDLTSLEVALRTLAVSWVGEFIAQNGLAVLLSAFKGLCLKIIQDPAERECQHQMIRCLKTLMNNAIGLNAMLNYPNGINILSLGFDCNNVKLKAMVLDLLGAVSLVPPNGHQLVVQAVEYFRQAKFERFRYQSIVQSLNTEDLDFQISCMAFANAIINSPEETEARMVIRNELVNVGIVDYLDQMKEINSPELVLQITVFEEEAAGDFNDTFPELVNANDLDISDPNEVFTLIKESVVEPGSYQWMFRTLQNLLVLSASAPQRNEYFWHLVSDIVQEIVLQRNCLRFDYHKLNFDIKQLISGFATESAFKQQQQDLESTRQQLALFGKDMESVQVLLIQRNEELKQARLDITQAATQLQKTEADLQAAQHQVELQSKKIEDLRQDGGNSGFSLPADFAIVLADAALPESTSVTPEVLQFFQSVVDEKLQLLKTPKPSKSLPVSHKLQSSSGDYDALMDAYGEEKKEQIESAGVPPPPPMMSGPPPPPPPGMGQAQPQKSRLKFQPKSKMRQLQWDKIQVNNLADTVWNQLHEDEVLQQQINFDEVEQVFGILKVEKKEALSPSPDKPKVINLLDAKKSYNMSIMLSRIKLTFPQVRSAVIGMQEDLLPESFVRQLLLYIPSTEEQTMLTDNLGSYEILGKPEQFYIEVMKITRYQQRLEGLLFKRHFNDRVLSVQSGLQTILDAATEVTKCPKFIKLLEIVLLIGNFMNNNSFKGNAYAFKIDTLTKLADVRTNGKGSFLNFIDTLVQSKFMELKGFHEEMPSVERASRVTMQAVASEFNELKRGIEQLGQEIQRHKDPADKNDKFYVIMQTFLDINVPKFEDVKQLMSQTEVQLKIAYRLYGEDSKVPTEQFFGIFSSFLISFDKAHKENELEAELVRKALEFERMEQKRKEDRKVKTKEALLGDTTKRGVMDDLITSLKNGDEMMKRSANRREHNRASKLLSKRDSQMLNAEQLLELLKSQYPE